MSLRRLRRSLVSRPARWASLLYWTLGVLALVVLRHLVVPLGSRAAAVIEVVLALSALAAVGLFTVLARRLYRGVHTVRDHLFEGDYVAALEAARRRPALATGLRLDAALDRLLQFDARQSERVTAATRLFDRLLREIPLPILLGDLEGETLRLSRALCARLDVADDRFPLRPVLLHPENRHLAHLWRQLEAGRKAELEDQFTLNLPVRQAARRLRGRLLAVQNDQGKIAYVLGLVAPPDPGQDDA